MVKTSVHTLTLLHNSVKYEKIVRGRNPWPSRNDDHYKLQFKQKNRLPNCSFITACFNGQPSKVRNILKIFSGFPIIHHR